MDMNEIFVNFTNYTYFIKDNTLSIIKNEFLDLEFLKKHIPTATPDSIVNSVRLYSDRVEMYEDDRIIRTTLYKDIESCQLLYIDKESEIDTLIREPLEFLIRRLALLDQNYYEDESDDD